MLLQKNQEAKVTKPCRNKEWSTLRKNHICNVGWQSEERLYRTEKKEKKKSLYNDSISSELSPALFHLQQSYCCCPLPPRLVHQAILKTDGTYPTCDALPFLYCIYFATNTNECFKNCFLWHGSFIVIPNFRDVLTFRYFHSNSLVNWSTAQTSSVLVSTFSASFGT